MKIKPKKINIKNFLSSHLGLILGLISLISSLFGGFFFLDNRYAKAAETVKIERRLENKIILDRIDRLQERLWKFQDRYGDKLEKAKDKLIKEEFKRLETEKELLEKSLEGVK